MAVLRTDPTDDWDALAVDRPGGHVLQSVAWAEHRRTSGWTPRFAVAGDLRILALTRPWPAIGGASAYVPRGPAPVVHGDRLGDGLCAVTRALAGNGIDVIAVDPEVAADDGSWRDWLRRARYRPIEEIQPSRHRLSLALTGGDESGIFHGIAKGTRQRIHKAEKQGVVIVRHDVRFRHQPGDGFVGGTEPSDAAFDRFYDLLLETGERRRFSFGPRSDYLAWWLRAHRAGHLVLLEAREGTSSGQSLAGLTLYRHGGRVSTAQSGDRAAARRAHPGVLHLLRWRAIQLAIREGCHEMDLGGVDVRGARHRPARGEAMHGLLEHKLSFGAAWVDMAGAHECVIRAKRYRAGSVVRAALRRLSVRRR